MTKDFMLGVSTFTWIVSLFPFLDWLMVPAEWALFWFWFRLCGASLSKDWKRNTVTGIVSLIPTIGAIFGAFPFVIYRNIRRVQQEDAEYNKSLGI